MELYKNKQEFIDIIIVSAQFYKINPAIVEKDYYVTLLLSELKNNIPGLVFKGGTSLSKCYKLIDRFSEDIDLSLDVEHFTQKNKRNANKKIIETCDKLGFTIQNRTQKELHSHANFNSYIIEYPITFINNGITPTIKVELSFIQKPYPDDSKLTYSIISNYLISIGKDKLLSEINLEPFSIKVQSLERTFVDKIFAICDYYLSNNVLRNSRHIYDIYKLSNEINYNDLKKLIKIVREERSKNKKCLSAQPGIILEDILAKIVKEDFYKKDYDEITNTLLVKKTSYEESITVIYEIINKHLF